MRIALRIFGDVDSDHVRNLLNDGTNVIDTDFTIFITLQEQKLASLRVIVSIDRRDWHFLLNTHIVKLGNELSDAGMRFGRGRRPHNPDPQSSTRV